MSVNAFRLLALILLAWGTQAAHAGEITGFQLKSCGEKNCLSISSPKAFSGIISTNYAFESAAIRIHEKTSQHITELNSHDVYFDAVSQKIYIRRMAEHKNSEAIYDLKAETLALYPLQSGS